jgi:anti-sigma factor RsiW
MTCKDAIEILADYVEGILSPDLVQELDEHLRLCPPCQAYVRTYKRTAELTGETGRVEMPAEMKRHLRELLLKGLARRSA